MTGPSWIPQRLKHLRRDARGLPVPFINQWGPSDTDRLYVAYDRTVGMDAVFIDDTSDMVPDFTKQAFQRQRLCMVDGLCQVCGRPVPWSRRFLVVADISVKRINVPGKGECLSLFEPWLDEQCALLAVERCPALVRRTRADNLYLIKVTSPRQVQYATSRGWLEGHLEESTKVNHVAMYVKAILPEGTITVVNANG